MIDHLRALLDQVGALAGQIAQGPLWGRRDETGAQQPVGEQLGNPLGILHVGLAPGYVLDVLRVDDQHREVAFQQVVEGLPELAGRFHRDVGDAQREQPVDQRQQPGSHGGEGADVGGRGAVGRHNSAPDNDGLLVDIESRTMRVDDLHAVPPTNKRIPGRLAGCRLVMKLTCVLAGQRRLPQSGVPNSIQVSLIHRLVALRKGRP